MELNKKAAVRFETTPDEIDKINLGRVQKDCLISYAGNQYSVPAEYVGKDVAVVALDSMSAAYYEGKQIALHRISYQKKDMVFNPQYYWQLTLKQTMAGKPEDEESLGNLGSYLLGRSEIQT